MKLSWEDNYKMPEEYDLSKLKRVPNPFFQKFQDLNLVSLDDDVKAAFPNSEAVNGALRGLMQRKQQPLQDELKKAS